MEDTLLDEFCMATRNGVVQRSCVTCFHYRYARLSVEPVAARCDLRPRINDWFPLRDGWKEKMHRRSQACKWWEGEDGEE